MINIIHKITFDLGLYFFLIFIHLNLYLICFNCYGESTKSTW